jgi:hypothetical protein
LFYEYPNKPYSVEAGYFPLPSLTDNIKNRAFLAVER